MPATPASFTRALGLWWDDPQGRRTLWVLCLTSILAVVCGVAQMMASSQVPILLPLGILLATAYCLMAVSRHLAALLIFLVAFSEFFGFLQESTEVEGIKVIDIFTALVALPLFVQIFRGGFPFHGTVAKRLKLATFFLLALISGEVFLTVLWTDQSLWL